MRRDVGRCDGWGKFRGGILRGVRRGVGASSLVHGVRCAWSLSGMMCGLLAISNLILCGDIAIVTININAIILCAIIVLDT